MLLSEVNHLATLQVLPKIWIQDYWEQIQLVARGGSWTLGLQITAQCPKGSIMLPPYFSFVYK